MNQILLNNACKEMQPFPHIRELALKKNGTIQLNSLPQSTSLCLRLYAVVDGKFSWIINGEIHTLYPGDMAVVLPGKCFGGEKDLLGIGAIGWLHLLLNDETENKKNFAGAWSGFSPHEGKAIAQLLLSNHLPVLPKFNQGIGLLERMAKEITGQEIGYVTRVNQLLDELLLLIARQFNRQTDSRKDFPQTFLKLEQQLRENLSHQWTVEEMAALVGLGTTAFSEKAKAFTGFAPLHYLINIRIAEAIKLLKRAGANVTDIAFHVGFYSSQHFATTFKKLTGYTPRQFRKENTSNND